MTPTDLNVLKAIGDRPIAFHPNISRIAGSVHAGLFLCQVVYWSLRSQEDGWFYKTVSDWEDETTLTQYEQEGVRKKLIDRGLIETMRRDLPCRTYYRVNWEALWNALGSLEYTPPRNVPIPPRVPIPPNQLSEKPITEHGNFRTPNLAKSHVTIDTESTYRDNTHTSYVYQNTEPTVDSPPKKTEKGTRLPLGWNPPKSAVEEIVSQFPMVQREQLRLWTDMFRDHFTSATGRYGVKRDWLATWRNWMRSEAQKEKRYASNRRPQKEEISIARGADIEAAKAVARGWVTPSYPRDPGGATEGNQSDSNGNPRTNPYVPDGFINPLTWMPEPKMKNVTPEH